MGEHVTVFSVLRKKLREQMNELSDHIALGNAADWPGYQRVVGKIEGLAYAERYILDLEQRMLKEDSQELLLS